jgi:hypothetical protein
MSKLGRSVSTRWVISPSPQYREKTSVTWQVNPDLINPDTCQVRPVRLHALGYLAQAAVPGEKKRNLAMKKQKIENHKTDCEVRPVRFHPAAMIKSPPGTSQSRWIFRKLAGSFNSTPWDTSPRPQYREKRSVTWEV